MQNQFCKKCGQANFPNVSVCSKCGTSLANQTNQNPFNASNEPPPTMENPQFSNTPKLEKKSNKMYWIIGGVTAVLVLFLGIAFIAGLGIYLYTNSSTDTEVANTSPKDNTNDEDKPINEDNGKSDEMTDGKLEDYIKNDRRTVGSYTLDNVKAFNGDDFSGRIAGVTALYINGSKRVVHSIAMFKTYAEASDDFSKYKRNIRNLKGSQVRSSEKDRVIFAHKGSIFLTFCNEAGGCHELISSDGKTILEYYDSYFGKS
ncbi:MAG: hypothetical protein ACR2J3_07695 [Aridibacter sp.]